MKFKSKLRSNTSKLLFYIFIFIYLGICAIIIWFFIYPDFNNIIYGLGKYNNLNINNRIGIGIYAFIVYFCTFFSLLSVWYRLFFQIIGFIGQKRGVNKFLSYKIKLNDSELPRIAVLCLSCNDIMEENIKYNMQQTYKNITWYIVDDSYQTEWINKVNEISKKYNLKVIRLQITDRKSHILSPVANALTNALKQIKDWDYYCRLDASTIIPHNYFSEMIPIIHNKELNLGVIAGTGTLQRNYYDNLFSYLNTHIISSIPYAHRQIERHCNFSSSAYGYGAPIFSYEAMKTISFEIPKYVAEDQLTPFYLLKNGYDFIVCPHVEISQYCPCDFFGFKKQWTRVCISTINILPKLWKKTKGNLTNRLSILIFFKIIMALEIPISVLTLLTPIFNIILNYSSNLTSLSIFFMLLNISVFLIPIFLSFRLGLKWLILTLLSTIIVIPSITFLNFEAWFLGYVLHKKSFHIAREKEFVKKNFWQIMWGSRRSIIVIILIVSSWILLYFFYNKAFELMFYILNFKTPLSLINITFISITYMACLPIICQFLSNIKIKRSEKEHNYDWRFERYHI